MSVSWLNIDCRHAQQLLSLQRDSRLNFLQSGRLRRHLRQCESCRRMEKQFDFLARAVKRLDQIRAPPPGRTHISSEFRCARACLT